MSTSISVAARPLGTKSVDKLDLAICVYLIFPGIFFCFWFAPAVAVLLLLATGIGVASVFRGASNDFPFSRHFLIAMFSVSLAWTALAGVGHFFYANYDWVIRDAVLHDLSISPWPPYYLAEDARRLILRAPVAYYLPAATLGHFAGLCAANIGLYLWTAFGWCLFLMANCRSFTTRNGRLISVLILTLFGGMDLIGYFIVSKSSPAIGEHIEWWASFIQYSSNTTLLFWVPNHAIPAWLAITLILRLWGSTDLAKITPLLATAIPLWSPLAAMGLFPFFLVALNWRRDYRVLLWSLNSIPFIPLALVVNAYLSMDASSVPHGWQAANFPSAGVFVLNYIVFCLLEFGFLLLFLLRIGKPHPSLIVAGCVLALLPLVYIGGGNDLAMRASIPALTVLALAAAQALQAPATGLWRHVLLVAIVIGFLGAAQEPLRALTARPWKPLNQSVPQSIITFKPNLSDPYAPNYFARANKKGVGSLLRDDGVEISRNMSAAQRATP